MCLGPSECAYPWHEGVLGSSRETYPTPFQSRAINKVASSKHIVNLSEIVQFNRLYRSYTDSLTRQSLGPLSVHDISLVGVHVGLVAHARASYQLYVVFCLGFVSI